MTKKEESGQAVRRRPGRPMRSERPAINRELLVAKLLEIAQTEGIDALNMRRVAKAFGVSPHALYHYVRDKEEMLDLLHEAIISSNPPDLINCDWESRLRRIAEINIQSFKRYPGLSAAVLSRTLKKVSRPQVAALRHEIFRALEQSGLDEEQVEETYVLFALISFGSMLMIESLGDQGEETFIEEEKALRSVELGLDLLIFGIKTMTSENVASG